MHVKLSEGDGYTLYQQAPIEELLEKHELAKANGVQIPEGKDRNEAEVSDIKYLVRKGLPGKPSIRAFQSLVGSLLWISRCTRPDISFAVHKATRRTHQPTIQ